MKVAVINTFDAKDITKWSGIPYHLSLFFDEFFKVKVDYVSITLLNRSLLSYLRGFYYNKLIGKKYYTWADESFINDNAKNVNTYVKDEYDIIITFQYFLVPLLKKKFNKVIHWNDGTFQNLNNFYPGYSNFSEYSFKAAHALQKRALDLSDKIIYSSNWATESAASFYHTDRKKLHKIPFASNFKTSLSKCEVYDLLKVKESQIVKLLFITADWERKGGHDAVKVVNMLNAKGIKAILYVVGANIPACYNDSKYLVHFGFINKNSMDGEARLINLFKESTFLIMPTRIDTTPVAFSEANSFALPIITTNVGAISSVINNHINGISIEVSNFVENSVQFILKYLPESISYKKLCLSSYEYHNENTSWEQVRLNFKLIVRDLETDLED